MHNLYFVLVDKDKAKNSRQARKKAIPILESEGFFFCEGYFTLAQADWAVVGGRSSGTLSNLMFEKDFFKELRKTKPDFSYTETDIGKARKELNKLWQSLGGKGLNPYNRNAYEEYGYTDDAQILTKSLAEKLKKEYAEVEIFDSIKSTELVPSQLSADAYGHWLVTIDYHC